ncbi:helicase-exonuclease AddAB subunit AddA [Ructibacterium gallinarum]|uniref:DNA 3'-5' helicase n=1 Tax=Ructibacterium gallinarum TaxID=2779355 RepID=A0A9D5RB81_9FIRM|nr:helicase-exonuclease AddAB subunit AddA [Ructibacterium gallinarum]MBE5039763.1 helicase-exonuclease AddAB subunit AddA [Ructibacterium gallinarum]
MAVQWTEEQLQAIEARGSSILVAAAAGSGKTAVLVERIIRRICDEKNPVRIDRLLVLTFTEAAASEMKRKIAQAIEQRLKQESNNQWLQEQSILVHSAHISTIHAFCKTILQNHVHETSLPAEFTIIDDTENEVLRNQALDQVLERYYKRIGKKEGFRDLAVGYGGIKNDENLRSTVLKLYNFAKSLARPEQWLRYAVQQYRNLKNTESLAGTVWEQLLLDYCRETAEDIATGLEEIWRLVEAEVPSDHKYFSYYKELREQFLEIFAPVLRGSANIIQVRRCCESYIIKKTPFKTGLEEELVTCINRIKTSMVTEPLKGLRAMLYNAEPERLEKMILCAPRIQTLKQLVRQTDRLHKTMKRERSALDFSDLEHEMLHLITDRKGCPTRTAEKLRNQFEEILVDEYQDTNNIQDTIFQSLSRNGKNIFMVGDLKQSIYKFRNADPSIFAEKYEKYSRGEGGICIRLFKNFRSRSTVIDSVNGIFGTIMTKKTGGLDYTREEYLTQGAAYPENAGNFETELLLTEAGKNHYAEDGEYANWSASRKEAVTVARRIRAMVAGCEIQVTDKQTGKLRPVRLGDITILARTKTDMAELEQVLQEYGIDAVSETGRSYLDSIEVMTVLSFLQIIDNPLQDIPLLAVLRSSMFDFSPDELAQIRLCAKGNYYTALCTAADLGNEKASAFLAVLNELREDAVCSGVDELIFKICYQLQYMALAGAMPGGKIRQANLQLLHQRGAEFEQGTLNGLFHFMAYIESLRENKKDMEAARNFADQKDTVSVTTIHKSKGLEYPVVILYGMQKEFNERDASRSVIWHEQAGLAMDYVDTRQRIRYHTLAKDLVRGKMIQDQRAEEMRLLYVAMTRAKEKLILSAAITERDQTWKEAVYCKNGVLPGFICRRRTMHNWVLAALLRHPSATQLREKADRIDILPDMGMDFGLKIQIVNHETNPMPLRVQEMAEMEKPVQEDKADWQEDLSLAQRLEYQYPHTELGCTPVKLSVSELKRRRMPEEHVPEIAGLSRAVLTEASDIGAAERGTITHYVMQHLDFHKTETEEQIRCQLDEMVQSGLIRLRQRQAVLEEGIFDFFRHPLGKRLANAERTEREFDFYMEIPAKEAQSGLSEEDGEEKVLLQGIADCFFYDKDGIVLIDYKTDRVTREEAKKRAQNYQLQMEYYARGLSQILKVPVKERYLYFLYCGFAVAM